MGLERGNEQKLGDKLKWFLQFFFTLNLVLDHILGYGKQKNSLAKVKE